MVSGCPCDHKLRNPSRELGVNAGTLGNWVGHARRGEDVKEEDVREEIARLRRENAELQMERDVLKRSVALWVNEAMGGR